MGASSAPRITDTAVPAATLVVAEVTVAPDVQVLSTVEQEGMVEAQHLSARGQLEMEPELV
jgi:hypothetical protein